VYGQSGGNLDVGTKTSRMVIHLDRSPCTSWRHRNR
jgi:hypothetical protein